MNLIGTYRFNGTNFFLCIKDTQQCRVITLISPEHRDDRIRLMNSLKPQHPILKTKKGVVSDFTLDYLVESIQIRKKTGKVLKYGTSNILTNIIDALAFAHTYSFRESDISLNDTGTKDTCLGAINYHEFDAADSKLEYNYSTSDGLFTYLRIKTSNVEFELTRSFKGINLKGVKYEKLKRVSSTRVMLSSLKDVTYDTLCDVLDMSWYKKDDKLQKNYQTIETVRDFELKIMTPMLQKIVECKNNHKLFDVAVDTETTGLNIYDLADDNPNKDHCVAIPICWEVDTSFVIFTDMEYFGNIPNSYAIDRLAQLFENFEGSRTINYFEEDSNGDLTQQSITINRDVINLIGHNAGFDGRVFFSYGKKFYFNQDTLQMAFDINPQTVRGNKKLKVLTRFFFHSETPELEDVLGKGNEDKYRYLRDKEVAAIYGCADADFTLGIFYKLKHLMTNKMFFWYQKQDIPMINILYQSEFYGLNTNAENVKVLTEQSRQNIEILKHLMFSYVGTYVNYTNKRCMLDAQYASGVLDEDNYNKAIQDIRVDPNSIYEFEFTPAMLRTVLYDIMRYPVKAYTDGKVRLPKIDKYVVTKLLKEKLKGDEKPFKTLERDVLMYGVTQEEFENAKAKSAKAAKSLVLISAEDFNRLKYPLALILQKYSEVNKEYCSYYKPMVEENLENKIFKSYNLARIETRRISNPAQTMKSNLKAEIRSYNDDYYVLDFDMSQVEQRIMVSLSGYTELILKMNDPENDAHTETASMVEGKPPYEINKKERKNAKSVTFGKPYGLGLRSLCEKIFGDTTQEHLVETAIIADKWERNNAPIVALLENARAQALTEWKISDELRDFMDMWKKDPDGNYLLDAEGNKIPIPVGKVDNILGFYRVFSLDGIDLTEKGLKRRAEGDYTSAESSIRRKAGNFPIQATASELFRQILIRFYDACKKYGIEDKVKWHMLIHDELLCSVKKDVHPFLMYKIIKEACMITLKGHTKYYVGINIGDSWADCKSDEREAPIHFVDRMIARYDAGEFEEGWFDHPWEFIKPLREQYIEDRIGEVIRKYQSDIDTAPIDLAALLNKFANYTVRAYVNDYPLNGEVDFEMDPDDPNSVALYNNKVWIKRLESWCLNVFGDGKEMIDLDGNVYAVHKIEKSKKAEIIDISKELEDLDEFDDIILGDDDDEDNYWSFDEDSAELVYQSVSEDQSADDTWEEDEIEFDLTAKGDNVTDVTIIEHRYRNLKLVGKQIEMSVLNRTEITLLKKYLKNNIVDIGYRVVFKIGSLHSRWEKVKENSNFDSVDDFLDFIRSDSIYQVNENDVFARIDNIKAFDKLWKSLSKFPGKDYNLTVILPNNQIRKISFSKRISI